MTALAAPLVDGSERLPSPVVEATDRSTSVLIASRQALFREAVRSALEGEAEIEVVLDTGEGSQAVAWALKLRPEIAMIDEDLDGIDGLEAVRRIKRSLPECPVLFLSGTGNDEQLFRAVEAGVNGFLKKESSFTELLDATWALRRGEMVLPSSMLRTLLDELLRGRKDREAALRVIAKLTTREKEVLSLLVLGGHNHDIAERLVISPETARTHIQHILAKLGVHSRLEAAAFVMRNRVDIAETLA